MKKLIGLSGTNASGKDTLGHLLQDRYEYKFLSLTDMLREEAARRELTVDRRVLHDISAEWRRNQGMDVLIDKAYQQYKDVYANDFAGLVVASLRHPAEADRVHKLGGIVVWVDADPEIRFARLQYSTRGRDGEDDKSFEEFLAEEQYEMQHSGDEATLNMGAVKSKADVNIFNNSTEFDHFVRTIDETFKPYL